MKCLIRMADAAGKGVIFYETVINQKWQKHTFIECVPVPHAEFDELPAYFKVSVSMTAHSEAPYADSSCSINTGIYPGL